MRPDDDDPFRIQESGDPRALVLQEGEGAASSGPDSARAMAVISIAAGSRRSGITVRDMGDSFEEPVARSL